MMKTLTNPHGNPIVYQGPGPEVGPLPALFYFALSGEESLKLHPYNSPAPLLEEEPVRVFSMTIPGHEPGLDKFHAMQYWADHMDNYVLENFFNEVEFAIDWLIQEEYIDPEHIAVGGLSRGGFVATHVAAKQKRIKTILGFAPLTQLGILKEFASAELPTHVKMRAQALDLEQIVDNLTHIHHLRFYIGNRDDRVSTDACYSFIRKLANKGHEVRAKHLNAELYIVHSIGHKGHGTAPHTFNEGTEWVKNILLG